MNNRFPQVSFVFDRYKKASLTKRASVELRISYNYRQKYMSTGILLYSNQWKQGRVINRADAGQIETSLNNLLVDVKQVILEMRQGGNINIMNIPLELKRKRQGTISFIAFCHQRTEIRKYGKSKSRQKRYNYFLSFLQDWGIIQDFSDITEGNIILFDAALKKKNITAYTKWHNYHEFLSSFIEDAINAGYIRKNPYKWVNIEKGNSSASIHKCLTPKEFQKIVSAKMPTMSLERVRDLFVFQTYTCLSYSDLESFDSSKIQEIGGMRVYLGLRHKTKKPFTVPLLPPALKILHKYNNVLPIISNVKYNAYLKVVAQSAKLDIPLTTHWARHTGATLLLNEGVDMRIVSKICGHASIKMTEQIYAKLLDETVVEAVKNLPNFIV